MQDSKNLILAIVLCLIVLFGWGRFAEYMGWVKAPEPLTPAVQDAARQEAPRQDAAEQAETEKNLPHVFNPAPGRDLTIDSPLYDAVLYTGGGILRSFRLKKFMTSLAANAPFVNMVDTQTADVAPLGLVINGHPSWSTGQWTVDTDAPRLSIGAGHKETLHLTGKMDNLRIVRELTFSADSYLISEKVRVANLSEQARSARISYTTAADASNASGGRYDSMRIAWDNGGSLSEESSDKTLESTGVMAAGNIHWAGVMSTYFLSAVLPADGQGLTIKGRLQKNVYRTAVEEPEITLAADEEKEFAVFYWYGPKERSLLRAASEELAKSIDLGIFSLIAKGLLWLLEIFYAWVHNWGVAIILLTILIKAVFWPLTARSYASMEKMKKLQPMMTAIREKNKDNKEQMNKEVMALYKIYGVNPASGCVPILIQLPVFFGLYQALLTSIELRHAPFIDHVPFTDIVWLADLSAQDPWYITPIVMGVTMFLQQKMSPPAADPTQQKIMMFLPLIFTVLFLGFPSGLVVYWLVNNILSIAQQWLMMKKNKTAARAAG
ncbi:membrane protein insertase YidC [Deltaproteobacteria bacterium]|nr:membrane protein insertase YidC [Deltaproteobacteria bacterium]